MTSLLPCNLHVRFWKDQGSDARVVKELVTVTEAFVRESEVWAQITAVADVLTKDGYISGTHPILRGISRRQTLPDLQSA